MMHMYQAHIMLKRHNTHTTSSCDINEAFNMTKKVSSISDTTTLLLSLPYITIHI